MKNTCHVTYHVAYRMHEHEVQAFQKKNFHWQLKQTDHIFSGKIGVSSQQLSLAILALTCS